MVRTGTDILPEIEAFLEETGMGASYFGKKAVGNSEVVARLRSGRRVWPETSAKILAFIAFRRLSSSEDKIGGESASLQPKGSKKHTESPTP